MKGPIGTLEALSGRDAGDLVHHCLEQGNVVLGKHFRDKLSKECIEWIDAYTVLKHGIIYDPPEPDIKTGEWKYRIEGAEPNGKWLVIVFCLKAIDSVFLITVFSIEARAKSKSKKK